MKAYRGFESRSVRHFLLAATDWIADSPEAKIKQAYQNILGSSADATGIEFAIKSGKSVDQIQRNQAYAKWLGPIPRRIVGAYVAY